jgi:tellurite resistance protein
MSRPAPVNAESLSTHALEREFGDLAALGFPSRLPPGTHAAMLKAIIAVAGADGEVSPKEFHYLLGRAKMFGTPDHELEEAMKFDPRSVPLGEVVKHVPPAARRNLLYESILVARSDGFAEPERRAAQRMARELGVDPAFVDAVESHLEIEDAVRRARIRLLTGRPPP